MDICGIIVIQNRAAHTLWRWVGIVFFILCLACAAADGALTNNDWRIARTTLPADGRVYFDTIVMVEMDIDADGLAEKLVSGPRNGKAGEIWTLFESSVDDHCVEVGNICFPSGACGIFVVEDFDLRPRLYSFRATSESSGGMGMLIAYTISGGEGVEIPVREIAWDEFRSKSRDCSPQFERRSTLDLMAEFPLEHLGAIVIAGTKNTVSPSPRRPERRIQQNRNQMGHVSSGGDGVSAAQRRQGVWSRSLTGFAIGVLIVSMASFVKRWLSR